MKWVLYAMGLVLSKLSPRAMRALASALGWCWLVCVRYRRRVVLENLAQAFPEQGERERHDLAHRALSHLVLVLIEFLRLPHERRRGPLTRLCRVEGLEHFEQARSRGRGVIVLSGHFGAWELGLCAAAPHTAPTSVVVKRLPRWIEGFASQLVRAGSGVQAIFGDGAMKAILRALKAGETVAFVLDQNATRSQGVFVDFFGRPACTLAGLAIIAERTGAPVVGAVAVRLGPDQHVLRISPEIPFQARASRDETVAHMTQRYTRFVEEAIRAHPEQWFWTHRRWKTRPKPSERGA